MWRSELTLVLASALGLLAGCGGAANEGWVREPEGGGSLGDEQVALEHDAAPPELTSDSAPQAGPRRLDHTVTLGEVYVTPPAPGAPGPASPGSSVTVTVNNYVTSGPGYGYGGYGVVPFVSRGGFSGGAASSPAFMPRGGGGTVQPGQSFPAPPSYGPAFPYQLSPASPWEARH